MSKTVQPHILKQYSLVKEMGSGAYGHVWQVVQKSTKQTYALKKVFDAFRNSTDAQRTYRQIEILHQIKHQNIIKLKKVIKAKNQKDLYLVFQHMQADLHSIVGTNTLKKPHQIFIFYQILKALKYLHSAQLIHRDLKPSNILINSQCTAKLCDFGLVRSLKGIQKQDQILSEQVATKWYRAPQLLLGSKKYNKSVDIWSVGCIVAEILLGKPIFPGTSTLNQLERILQFKPNITRDDLAAIQSPIIFELLSEVKPQDKTFSDYFRYVDNEFYPLIKGLLQFNPHKRLTIDQALQLSLFCQFQGDQLQISKQAIKPFLNDNVKLTTKQYQDKIYCDIQKRYSVRQTTSIHRKYQFTRYLSQKVKSASSLNKRDRKQQPSISLLQKSFSRKSTNKQYLLKSPYNKSFKNLNRKYYNTKESKPFQEKFRNGPSVLKKKVILKNVYSKKNKQNIPYLQTPNNKKIKYQFMVFS